MAAMSIDNIETTRDIKIPKAPIDRIIGQERNHVMMLMELRKSI